MPADAPAGDRPLVSLRAESIRKNYGATIALRGVDIEILGGAVSVLIGENGAGKSTLMRILAGVEQPDGGRLVLDGEPVSFASTRAAARAGIGIVFQELNLCPNLTVTENIFLSNPLRRGGVIDPAAERARAAEVLARLGGTIDPDTPVASLKIGQQQIVEIARALVEDVRILILDEPTSALSATEVDILFGIIAELKAEGVGIVYISHRLEELMRIGDHITVLRDGAIVASAPAREVSVPWIVEQMLGDTQRAERRSGAPTAGAEVLSLKGVTVRRGDGAALVSNVSVSFRAGEIVGIYGLLGAGRTELLEYAGGARGGEGVVRLNGEAIERRDIVQRIARGLLLVPEDRQRDGLFANFRVGGNLTITALRKMCRKGVLSVDNERDAVSDMIGRLRIKAPNGKTAIGALSGGNQQKVVIGRSLMANPTVVLLDEPSRGIDVGARAEIFETMRALAADGIAVVFSTSDLIEATTIADRIVVMAGGRVTADLPIESADEATLVRAGNGIDCLSRVVPFPTPLPLA